MYENGFFIGSALRIFSMILFCCSIIAVLCGIIIGVASDFYYFIPCFLKGLGYGVSAFFSSLIIAAIAKMADAAQEFLNSSKRKAQETEEIEFR